VALSSLQARSLSILLVLCSALALTVSAIAPAEAQWGCRSFGGQGGNGCNSAIAAPPSSFSLTYGGSAGSGTTASTIDYGNISFPTGQTRLIVAIQWTVNGTGHVVTGVTVGGTGCSGGTALAQVPSAYIESGNSSGQTAADVWMSTGSLAGGSLDVCVTYNIALGWKSAVAGYGVITTTPTPSAFNGFDTNGTVINAGSFAIPSGVQALIVTGSANGTAISSETTWSLDATVSIASSRLYYFGRTTSMGSVTPSAASASNDGLAMSAVVWGP
jgi:hypothetical protein